MSEPLTDEAIQNALLGVVEPPLPGPLVDLPGPAERREYATALDAVDRSLELAKHRLENLRAARDGINDEIRDLVTEVELLTRMRRVAEQPRKRKEPS